MKERESLCAWGAEDKFITNNPLFKEMKFL